MIDTPSCAFSPTNDVRGNLCMGRERPAASIEPGGKPVASKNQFVEAVQGGLPCPLPDENIAVSRGKSGLEILPSHPSR
jgi:hypothetical protein